MKNKKMPYVVAEVIILELPTESEAMKGEMPKIIFGGEEGRKIITGPDEPSIVTVAIQRLSLHAAETNLEWNPIRAKVVVVPLAEGEILIPTD
jgi:hypothetical protein